MVMAIPTYITADELAIMIREAHSKGFDMTGIHKAADETRGKTEEAQKADELKAAVVAAKTSSDRPRTFAVAYRNPRGAVKVAHGVEYSNKSIHIESGNNTIGGYEDTLADMHKEAKTHHGDAYHFDYTDEP